MNHTVQKDLAIMARVHRCDISGMTITLEWEGVEPALGIKAWGRIDYLRTQGYTFIKQRRARGARSHPSRRLEYRDAKQHQHHQEVSYATR